MAVDWWELFSWDKKKFGEIRWRKILLKIGVTHVLQDFLGTKKNSGKFDREKYF